MKKMNKFNMNSQPFLTSKNGFPSPQIKPPPVFDPNRRDATYSSLQIYLHTLISITHTWPGAIREHIPRCLVTLNNSV